MYTLGDLIRKELSLWCRCEGCGKVRFRSPGSICVPHETAAADVGKFMKCSTCGSCNIKTAAAGPLTSSSGEGDQSTPEPETGFGALQFEPRGAKKGDDDGEDVFD